MLVDGDTVARTTGTDVEAMKESLYRSYFHVPEPATAKKPRRK